MHMLHIGIEPGADCAVTLKCPIFRFNSDGARRGNQPNQSGPGAKETNVELNTHGLCEHDPRRPGGGFSDRFNALLKVAADLIARRKVYTQTVFELNTLSDRDWPTSASRAKRSALRGPRGRLRQVRS